MTRLPVIIGCGGVNAAGRSLGHHAYRRMVIDALPAPAAAETWQCLARLMGLETGAGGPDAEAIAFMRQHTLVRRIEPALFDSDRVPVNRPLRVAPERGGSLVFVTRAQHLPVPVPHDWQVRELGNGEVRVEVPERLNLLLPQERPADVNVAGQLPNGFDPRVLYPARNHPRGLQMTVFGASDALHSLGFDWERLRELLAPDQLAVYAGSGMGQLDVLGAGGMLSARAWGRRVTSKQCPMSFAEMPADFINAYLLGGVGATGTRMGACASFLYNLEQAVRDIQSGRARAVLVGNAEAPVTPEIIDGYAAMGALATDAELRALDGLESHQEPDYRRACRPFAANCGFTIAESAQFFVLVDDALALELGANVLGSVADVFIHADGYKKSISSPGIGNYLSMARAMAAGRALLGDGALRRRSLVMAHGTGTPQNRVTESHILNSLADRFGIDAWPVAAIKCFLGHSIGAAAGDQLAATLGAWHYGIVPGIATIEAVAEDVHASRLDLSPQHRQRDPSDLELAIINAKGFGGNNASAVAVSARRTLELLARRHGAQALSEWRRRNEAVAEQARRNEEQARQGRLEPIYRFDYNVLDGDDLDLSTTELRVPGYAVPLRLDASTPYVDMRCDAANADGEPRESD